MLLLSKSRFLLFVLGVLQFVHVIQGAEKISPTAWGIARSKKIAEEASKNDSPARCPTPQCNCDEDLGSIYYLKLVNYLFRKSQPIMDDFDGKHLISIHLQITAEHMQALRDTENVRDIDAIVSSVIENSRGGIVMEAKEVLLSWYDRIHYAYLRVINSQTLILIILVCIFLVSVVLMRLLLKINLIAVIVINLIFVSLFFNYLDCNRRLEFENMEKMKTLTEQPNPCERTKQYMGLVSNYDSKKCTAYMMSMHGHDRQFCEPVDFVWDFVLSLLLKPAGKFLDTVGGFVDQSFAKYGIIKGTIIALIVICAMSYWMRDFLKAFFGMLWTGRPASLPNDYRKSIDREDTPAAPSVLNLTINLDRRAIGDYVQEVKRDEEKSRLPAICLEGNSPSGSHQKVAIENVADGFDLINQSDVVGDLEPDKEEKAPNYISTALDDKEELKKAQ